MKIVLISMFASIILLLGVIRGEIGFSEYRKLRDARNLLEKAVNQLSQEILDLTQDIDRLQSSPVYARKVLRDKYHLTEENEKIVFFSD